jgi:hypothetical protein
MMDLLVRCIVLLLLAVGVGCESKQFSSLSPGAELVRVTTNPSVVEGGELLATGWCRSPGMGDVHTYAKNFTAKHGGNVALIAATAAGNIPVISATVEAYRVP